MEGRLLLDVVVRERSTVLELTREDETLLLRGDSLLVLDLSLDILDRVVRLHIECDRLTGEGFDEDLHGSTAKAKYQVQGGLLLDVVVRERSTVLELLSGEDES